MAAAPRPSGVFCPLVLSRFTTVYFLAEKINGNEIEKKQKLTRG